MAVPEIPKGSNTNQYLVSNPKWKGGIDDKISNQFLIKQVEVVKDDTPGRKAKMIALTFFTLGLAGLLDEVRLGLVGKKRKITKTPPTTEEMMKCDLHGKGRQKLMRYRLSQIKEEQSAEEQLGHFKDAMGVLRYTWNDILHLDKSKYSYLSDELNKNFIKLLTRNYECLNEQFEINPDGDFVKLVKELNTKLNKERFGYFNYEDSDRLTYYRILAYRNKNVFGEDSVSSRTGPAKESTPDNIDYSSLSPKELNNLIFNKVKELSSNKLTLNEKVYEFKEVFRVLDAIFKFDTKNRSYRIKKYYKHGWTLDGVEKLFMNMVGSNIDLYASYKKDQSSNQELGEFIDDCSKWFKDRELERKIEQMVKDEQSRSEKFEGELRVSVTDHPEEGKLKPRAPSLGSLSKGSPREPSITAPGEEQELKPSAPLSEPLPRGRPPRSSITAKPKEEGVQPSAPPRETLPRGRPPPPKGRPLPKGRPPKDYEK